jgi:hypothetical protein
MGGRRTIITVSDEDKLWLENYSKSQGVSVAETIRRGIARLKDEEGKPFYQLAVKETKGIWQQGDGLEYQKNVRSEWR